MSHQDVRRVAVQGESEYRAGYQSGYAGGDKPGRDKGRAYYGGWMAGKALREDEQELQGQEQ